MSLFEQWEKSVEEQSTQEAYDRFIQAYLQKEKEVYEQILENRQNMVTGKLKELAEKYNMTSVEFTGFLDGINTSLTDALDLEKLEEDTELALEIDFEKLYVNMLDAKAQWLYTLPQWDGILDKEQREQMKKEYNRSKIVVKPKKIGRNDPCPCGSGKKYKKCCGK
jgi:uncharacterized protein YecA (UPF0149 family)